MPNGPILSYYFFVTHPQIILSVLPSESFKQSSRDASFLRHFSPACGVRVYPPRLLLRNTYSLYGLFRTVETCTLPRFPYFSSLSLLTTYSMGGSPSRPCLVSSRSVDRTGIPPLVVLHKGASPFSRINNDSTRFRPPISCWLKGY